MWHNAGRRIAQGSKRFAGLFSFPTGAVLVGGSLTIPGLYMIYPPLALLLPGTGLIALGAWLVVPPKRRR